MQVIKSEQLCGCAKFLLASKGQTKFNPGPSGGVLLFSVVVGFSVVLGLSVVIEFVVVISAEAVELEICVEVV